MHEKRSVEPLVFEKSDHLMVGVSNPRKKKQPEKTLKRPNRRILQGSMMVQ